LLFNAQTDTSEALILPLAYLLSPQSEYMEIVLLDLIEGVGNLVIIHLLIFANLAVFAPEANVSKTNFAF
jgi:hypothetical protein